MSFNPRARAGRDDPELFKNYIEDVFQSTRPRGARLTHSSSTSPGFVSIHAPARGATTRPHTSCCTSSVSIHAPARGATFAGVRVADCAYVSIHAPARGATTADNKFTIALDVSIHAPARGATRSAGSSTPRHLFQSTRPRGARRQNCHGR